MSKPREQFRAILETPGCTPAAPVFSPLSARLAEVAGWEVCKMSGSVGKWADLAVPDAVSMANMTDLVDVCRRITRVIDIPLSVDADDGLRGGAPLSIRRSIRELEQAGAASVEIEDNTVPMHFTTFDPTSDLRSPGRHDGMIPQDDQVATLRAAVETRQDPSTVIVAKTHALYQMPLEPALDRIRAYAATGVDAVWAFIYPFGKNGRYERHYPDAPPADPRSDIEAIRSVTDLPMIVSGLPPDLVADEPWLVKNRVALRYLSQAPYRSAIKSIYDALVALKNGADGDSIPEDFPADVQREVIRERQLRQWDEA